MGISERIRQNTRNSAEMLKYGGRRVNNFIWYHVDKKDFPDELSLHLFEISKEDIKDKRRVFEECKRGLDILADRLAARDPEFDDITHVVAWSFLVYDSPYFFERQLGFQKIEFDKPNEHALASMTRGQFVQKPWRKVEPLAPQRSRNATR